MKRKPYWLAFKKWGVYWLSPYRAQSRQDVLRHAMAEPSRFKVLHPLLRRVYGSRWPRYLGALVAQILGWQIVDQAQAIKSDPWGSLDSTGGLDSLGWSQGDSNS